ncbi:MAG: CPBP family intramembrane metalloprotease [Candidatus Eremiobacteraeota bacterium]|nr:CPBP family intramembrane metalloprotease [Candidatus Eremiobacteraeota bacterium]
MKSLKKVGILFLLLIVGWIAIILVLSLFFRINPLDFFSHSRTNIFLNVVFFILLYGLVMSLIHFKLKNEGRGGLKGLGLSPGKYGYEKIFIGVLVFFLAFSTYSLILVLSGAASFKCPGVGKFVLGILSAILFGFLISFIEEILFRGYIFQTLMKDFSIPAALLLTNVPFALLHIFRSGSFTFKLMIFLGILTLGTVLSYLYLSSESLWMCVGAHGSLVACMYMFSTFLSINKEIYSKQPIIWGMREIPVAGVAGIALILFATIAMVIILRRARSGI